MKFTNETIRNSALQNPFATPAVSGRGLAVSGVVATAYAALFAVAIAQNEVRTPETPVAVAAAEVPANWGLEIRGLSRAELAAQQASTDLCKYVRNTACDSPGSLLDRIRELFTFA